MDTPRTSTYQRFAAAFVALACDRAMEVTGVASMAELIKLLNAELGSGNEISRNTLDNWRLGKGKAARCDAVFALLKLADTVPMEVMVAVVLNHPRFAGLVPRVTGKRRAALDAAYSALVKIQGPTPDS